MWFFLKGKFTLTVKHENATRTTYYCNFCVKNTKNVHFLHKKRHRVTLDCSCICTSCTIGSWNPRAGFLGHGGSLNAHRGLGGRPTQAGGCRWGCIGLVVADGHLGTDLVRLRGFPVGLGGQHNVLGDAEASGTHLRPAGGVDEGNGWGGAGSTWKNDHLVFSTL